MVRDYRDRADDSLLTLLGDLPDLVSNLVKAEIDAAKTWVARTSKDAGIGSVWFLVALFFLFWAVPVVLVFSIAGLSSWFPVWLSAIITFGILLLAVLVFALLGILKFRGVLRRENPAQAVATDVRIVKEAGDGR
ncbi:phage holin family protein [Microbacterium azadirachtae]|uniref:phage holin family protein n=1 Tax=Microbacterium azadirachtae TaxID=582680 RepID=UPI00088D4AA1|nr:phage holin family protein [Microbacterium azadirachtae]SDM19136.1 Putative Holin-X, holin superfamily III [Microbacterium azadirachtae]SEG41877.1 Putative Holin-X, holin superfamily III [Microbacterium azadirachtae]SEG44835.1 Putative Holin-X, holin superfamily III [Microbacterium azadirachtae]